MEAERESIDAYQAMRREGARGFTRSEDLLRNLLRMMESSSRNAADAVVLLRSEFCGR